MFHIFNYNYYVFTPTVFRVILNYVLTTLWRGFIYMAIKKSLIFFTTTLMVVLLIGIFASCKTKTNNLISNGSFEENEIETTASVDQWGQQIENSVGEIAYIVEDEEITNHGKRYASYKIENSSGGQIYSEQKVVLRKGKTYKLTADFNIQNKIAGIDENSSYRGAFIGFVEVPKFAGLDIKEKTDGWKTETIYFKNDYGTDLTLRVGLGSVVVGLARGEAKIDNISLEEVSKMAIPASAAVQSLSKETIEYKSTPSSKAFVWMMGILSLLVVAGAGFLIFKFKNKGNDNGLKVVLNNPDGSKLKQSNQTAVKSFFTSAFFILGIITVVAFVIRFLLMYFSVNVVDEVNKLSAFSLTLAKYSPTAIYEESSIIMPFGMMYLQWFIGLFANAIGMTATSWGLGMLIRIPGLMAELFTILVIFKIVEKYFGKNVALVASGVFAILPIFFMTNSSMLYNFSVAMLFILLMFYGILQRRPVFAIVMFTLAWTFEYYVLLLLPLLVYYTVGEYLSNKETRMSISISYVTSILSYWVLAIPFSYTKIAKMEIFHIFTKQGEYFKTFEFLSFDTFNLYSIFWKGNTPASTALVIFGIIYVLAIIGFMVYAYFFKTNRADTILLSSFLLISMGSLGTKATPMLYAAGLILLLVYIMLVHDLRLFGIFAGFSVISAVNISVILSNSGILSANYNKQYTSFKYDDSLLITFSVFAVLLTIYFAYVIARIVLSDEVKDVKDIADHVRSFNDGIKAVKENRKNKVKIKKQDKENKNEVKVEKEVRENYGIKKEKQKKK